MKFCEGDSAWRVKASPWDSTANKAHSHWVSIPSPDSIPTPTPTHSYLSCSHSFSQQPNRVRRKTRLPDYREKQERIILSMLGYLGWFCLLFGFQEIKRGGKNGCALEQEGRHSLWAFAFCSKSKRTMGTTYIYMCAYIDTVYRYRGKDIGRRL